MNDNEKLKKQLWYVRRDNEIQGPFPAGLITRYILLGRIHRSDEVSSDKDIWCKISDIPELIPEVAQLNIDDPVSRQRLMAAKRWADERTIEDRRQLNKSVTTDRRKEGRRSFMDNDELKRTDVGAITKEKGERRKRDKVLAGLIAVCIVTIVGVTMYQLKPKPAESTIDCNALPRPGVNWSNCHKEGATLKDVNLIGAVMNNMNLSNADLQGSQLVKTDLSYSLMPVANLKDADLRTATLIGVNLRQSDLSNANLKGANLSYADLSGANLAGTQMDDAKLGNAIWIDGRKCGPDSIGQCKP